LLSRDIKTYQGTRLLEAVGKGARMALHVVEQPFDQTALDFADLVQRDAGVGQASRPASHLKHLLHLLRLLGTMPKTKQ